MATATNQITKIYELKTLGFSDIHKQFQTLNQDLKALRDIKKQLNSEKTDLTDAKEIAEVNTKIAAVTKLQADAVTKSAGAYAQLIKQYKEAKTNAADMAAEFGTESDQAKVAAASLADYKSQLAAVNSFLKSSTTAPIIPKVGETQTPQTAVVSGDNLAELAADQERLAGSTSQVVSQLEQEQALAVQEAIAWAETQVQSVKAVEANTAAVEKAITPYQEYTGTLEQNISLQLSYQERLAEISAELKAGTGNTIALKQEQNELKIAAAELSQTINAQTKYIIAAEGSYDQLNAQVGLARNSLRQMTEEEKASAFGKNVAADVTVLDTKLKSLDEGMGNHQRSVGNYGKAFENLGSKLVNFVTRDILRAAAGFLVFQLAFTALEKLGEALGGVIAKWFEASDAEKLATANLQNFNDVMSAASKTAGVELTSLRELYEAATDVNQPMAQRIKNVVDLQTQFPDYFGKLNQEIILNGQAKDSYLALADSIKVAARAQAAKDKIADLERQKLDLDIQAQKIENATNAEKSRVKGVAFGDFQGGGEQTESDQKATVDRRKQIALDAVNKSKDALNQQQAFLQQFIKGGKDNSLTVEDALNQVNSLSVNQLNSVVQAIDKEANTLAGNSPKLAELKKQRDVFQKRLDELKDKPTHEHADRLSAGEKNDLNEIDAGLKKELAVEETRYAELQKNHKASYDEERQYVNNIEAINLKYLDQKIKLFADQKSLNAKEQADLAEFKKQKADIELKSQQEILQINQREYDEEARRLKENLDKRIVDIENGNKQIQDDASVSNTDKANAQIAADQAILAAQEQYYNSLNKLDQHYTDLVAKNAEDRARTQEKVLQDQRKVLDANIKDIDDAAAISIDKIKQQAADKTIDLLSSGKSASQIAKGLKQIEDEANRQILLNDAARLKLELDAYEKGARDKIKTEKEYQDKLAEYKKAETQVVQDNINQQLTAFDRLKQGLKDFANSFKENVLGIKQYTDDAAGQQQKYADAVTQSQNTIKQAITEAYQDYFRNQAAQIDRNLQTKETALSSEEEQVKARAQSQAEIDSIDKQYAAKKKVAEKQAGEEKKKLALKQLEIDYAVAVVKSLAQYGLPAALLPIAAETILFFVQKSNVQKQQFAHGGYTGPGSHTDNTGHRVAGVVHDNEWVAPKWMVTHPNYGRVVAGLENVRQKGFAAGGYTNGLGTSLQAPVYIPSSSAGNGNSLLVAEVRQLRSDLASLAEEQSKRVDRLEVVQVTNSVTTAQKKQVKQNSIGVL